MIVVNLVIAAWILVWVCLCYRIAKKPDTFGVNYGKKLEKYPPEIKKKCVKYVSFNVMFFCILCIVGIFTLGDLIPRNTVQSYVFVGTVGIVFVVIILIGPYYIMKKYDKSKEAKNNQNDNEKTGME